MNINTNNIFFIVLLAFSFGQFEANNDLFFLIEDSVLDSSVINNDDIFDTQSQIDSIGTVLEPSYAQLFEFNIIDGSFLYSPETNYNGLDQFEYCIYWTIDDEQLSNCANVSITIDPVNDAPVISGASDLDTDEDAPIQILLTDLLVNDIENDALTLYLNEGDNYSVLDNQVVPDSNYNGPLTVEVYVLDDGDPIGESNTWPVSVTVNPVNDNPEFTLSWDAYGDNEDEFIDISNILEDFSYSLQLTPMPLPIPDDELDQEVTYSLEIDDLSVIDTTSFDIDTGVIVFNHISNANGQANFILSATDNVEPSSSTFSIEFNITVLAQNDPVVAIESPFYLPTIYTESDIFTNPAINITNLELFSDIDLNDPDDGEFLVYSIESISNTTLITDTSINGDNLVLFFGNEENGQSEITLIATDQGGASDSIDIFITVDAENDTVSTITFPGITFNEDDDHDLNGIINDLTIDLDQYFYDLDEDYGVVFDDLTFSVINGSYSDSISYTIDQNAGEILFSFAENLNGDFIFEIKAEDEYGESNSQLFDIHIIPINDAPIFTGDWVSASDQYNNLIDLEEDFDFSITFSPVLGLIPNDEIDQIITYTINPDTMSFVNAEINSSTGEVTITAFPHLYGNEILTIIATDSGQSQSQDNQNHDNQYQLTFPINVNEVNDPVITNQFPSLFTLNEDSGGTGISWDIDLDDYFYDVDQDSGAIQQDLNFSLADIGSSEGMTGYIFDQDAGVLTLNFQEHANGVYTYLITATDNYNGTVSSENQVLNIEVIPENDPVFVKQNAVLTYQYNETSSTACESYSLYDVFDDADILNGTSPDLQSLIFNVCDDGAFDNEGSIFNTIVNGDYLEVCYIENMNTCETDYISICAVDVDENNQQMGSAEEATLAFDVVFYNNNIEIENDGPPNIEINESESVDVNGNSYCSINLDQYFKDIDEFYGCPLQTLEYSISSYCTRPDDSQVIIPTEPSINNNNELCIPIANEYWGTCEITIFTQEDTLASDGIYEDFIVTINGVNDIVSLDMPIPDHTFIEDVLDPSLNEFNDPSNPNSICYSIPMDDYFSDTDQIFGDIQNDSDSTLQDLAFSVDLGSSNISDDFYYYWNGIGPGSGDILSVCYNQHQNTNILEQPTNCLTVIADDNNGSTASDEFCFEIQPQNDPVYILEDAQLNFDILEDSIDCGTYYLYDIFDDIDILNGDDGEENLQNLTFSICDGGDFENSETIFSANIDGDFLEVCFTEHANTCDYENIVICSEDYLDINNNGEYDIGEEMGSNISSPIGFKLLPEDDPTIYIDGQSEIPTSYSVLEGAECDTFNLDYVFTDIDIVDNGCITHIQNLSYSIDSYNQGLFNIPNLTNENDIIGNELIVCYNTNWNGTDSLIVRATDSNNGNAEEPNFSFEVIVEPVNDIPVAIINNTEDIDDNDGVVIVVLDELGGRAEISLNALHQNLTQESDTISFTEIFDGNINNDLPDNWASYDPDLDMNMFGIPDDPNNGELQTLTYTWYVQDDLGVYNEQGQGGIWDVKIDNQDLSQGVYEIMLVVEDNWSELHFPETNGSDTTYTQIRVVKPQISIVDDFENSISHVFIPERQYINLKYTETDLSSTVENNDYVKFIIPESITTVEFDRANPPSSVISNFIYSNQNNSFNTNELIFEVNTDGGFIPLGSSFFIDSVGIITSGGAAPFSFEFEIISSANHLDDLSDNDQENLDDTFETIQAGTPDIYFSENYDQIFVCNDVVQTLSPVSGNSIIQLESFYYEELFSGSGSAFEDIRIEIPENINLDLVWHEAMQINIVGGDNASKIDISSISYDNEGKVLVLPVLEIFDGGQTIEIQGLEIEILESSSVIECLDPEIGVSYSTINPFELELNLNEDNIDNNIFDIVVDENIRMGQPKLSMDLDDYKIYILSDETVELPVLKYLPDNVGVASYRHNIKIKIPSPANENFQFEEFGFNDNNCAIYGTQQLSCSLDFENNLVIDLSSIDGNEIDEISPSNDIIISGVNIDLIGESSDFYLELDVSGDPSIDYTLESSGLESGQFIRVADPSISLNLTNDFSTPSSVFLLSDSNLSISPCENSNLEFPEISISQGEQSAFYDGGTIMLELPSNLEWAPCSQDSMIITDSGITLSPIPTFNANQLSFSYTGDASAEDEILISGLYVLPNGLTIGDGSGLKIYENSVNPLSDAITTTNLYVGDIEIFIGEEGVEEQQAFVYSDADDQATESVNLRDITIKGIPDEHIDWDINLLSYRDFNILLPANIHWVDNSEFIPGLDNLLHFTTGPFTEPSKQISNITASFLDLQSSQPIQLIMNQALALSGDLVNNDTGNEGIRVGEPSIDLLINGDESNQIFVYQENDEENPGILIPDILYVENEIAAVGLESRDFYINILPGSNLEFLSINPLVNNAHTVTIEEGNKSIKVDLISDLSPNDSLWITGINVVNGTTNSTFLSLDASGNEGLADDTTSQFIQIGDPGIYSCIGPYGDCNSDSQLNSREHLFISGECEAPLLETLVIYDSEYPTINTNDGLHIIIPDDFGASWGDNFNDLNFSGSAAGKVGSNPTLILDNKVIRFPVLENFSSNDTIEIRGLWLEGISQSDVSGDYLSIYTQDNLALENTDIIEGAYREDDHRLVIATPSLSFTRDQQNRYVVGDRPSPMTGLRLRDAPNHSIIKEGQEISIKLADEGKLEWDHQRNSNYFDMIDNFTYNQIDSLTFTITPGANFELDSDNISDYLALDSMYVKNFQDTITNRGKLKFSVRNEYCDLLESIEESGEPSFTISKPEFSSLSPQIFYNSLYNSSQLEQFQSQDYYLYPIQIKDDEFNPVFYLEDSHENLRDEFRIIIPQDLYDELVWVESMAYINPQNSSIDNDHLENLVVFQDSSVIISFNSTFENNNPIIFYGLGINGSTPTPNPSNLEFSLQTTKDENRFVDNELIGISQLDIESTEVQIITKGQNALLNDIVLTDHSTSSIRNIATGKLYLPPRLSAIGLRWDPSVQDSLDLIADGVECVGVSGGTMTLNFSGYLDEVTLSGLSIINETSLSDTFSINWDEDKIIFEPGDNFGNQTGQYMKDSENTLLVSAYIKNASGNDDRIAVENISQENMLSYRIDDLVLGNDQELGESYYLMNEGDVILLEFDSEDEFSCSWDIDSLQPSELLANNEDRISFKEANSSTLSFTVLEDIGYDQDFPITISELKIICSDTGKSNILLKVERDPQLGLVNQTIGQNENFIAIGEPSLNNEISIQKIKSEREFDLPSITVFNDENILDPYFKICLFHESNLTPYLEFTNSEGIMINGEELAESFNIIPDSSCIGFYNNSGTYIMSGNLIISGLRASFRDEMYLRDLMNTSLDFPHSVRLILGETIQNDIASVESESDKYVTLEKTLFFDNPLLRMIQGEPFLEFNILRTYYDNPLEDIDNIYFSFNNNNNLSIMDNSPLPIINNQDNYVDDDVYDTYRVRVNLQNIIEEFNNRIDIASTQSSDLDISISNIFNSRDSDDSELIFYPNISADAFIFPMDRTNNTTSDIEIQSNYEPLENIRVDLSFVHNESISFPQFNCNSSQLTCNEESGTLQLNLAEILDDSEDGIYSIDLSVVEEGSQSIPFQRKFLIDTVSDSIYDVFPQPGMAPGINNFGHYITNQEEIDIYVKSGPVFIGENIIHSNPSYPEYPLDLRHILFNEIDFDLEINMFSDNSEDVIFSTQENNTILLNDNHEAYRLIDNGIYDNYLTQNGVIEYKITLRDEAGNETEKILSYYIQTEQEEANNRFFNYPNPFSSLSGEETHLTFNVIDEFDAASLIIFDVSGQIVYMENLDSKLSIGTHEVIWDGKTNQGNALSTGVYFSIIQFSNSNNNNKSKTRVNKIAIINND